jgi:hypothetical protein
MAMTALPTAPSRGDSANFTARADALLGALPTFVTEANALQSDVSTRQASAVAAQASAAAAQASSATAQAAAEAALANFNTKYLGVKAAAPTLDNAGGALAQGALYYDSVLQSLRVRVSTAWVTIPNNYIVGAVAGPVWSAPSSVAFSATPVFNASASNVLYLAALTAPVTAFSITNPSDGQTLNIRFVQDATGGRTVGLPANVKAFGGPNTSPSRVTWLVLTYVASAAQWEGAWQEVPA